MNKLILLVLAAVLAVAAGCGTTEQSFMADAPLPVVRGDAATTTVDPVRLTAGHGPVTEDQIDEDNVHDLTDRLEAGIRMEKRAMSKAGK